MNFEEIAQIPPYSLDKAEKEKMLTERLRELTEHHRKNCSEYGSILKGISYDDKNVNSYEDIPFLPVRLFKEKDLKSVPDEEIVKTMTSSGTSGQRTSKIYLDKATSANQQKAMVRIVSEFTGSSRMPMIIIDCPSVVKDRRMFSARGAGILGFSIFGSKKMYALDDDMHLNVDELREFIETYKDRKILMFGFTFMVWKHFYKELVRIKEETGETFDLSNAVLIHGGGWKKLISEAVSPEEFHDRLQGVCALNDIHDYYGMVEQTGCIYMQCECGHLHASIFSDVIIRRPQDFSVADIGEKGIIQVVSAIPQSYPGHSLLTEDEGIVLGEDDCPCGRRGKYFKILGRLSNAEIRGCSDTYAAEHGGDGKTAGQAETDTAVKSSEEDSAVHTPDSAPKAAIAVPDVLSGVWFLTGDALTLAGMRFIPVRQAFDTANLEFLNALSKKLMGSPEAKIYPDVATLGFWLRKSSLEALKRRFGQETDGVMRVGRGVAFHIAPSNVAVNFAYSLVSGLICGDANVVRIPTKEFPQVRIIVDAINAVLDDFPDMRPYICLVRYGRDTQINDYMSQLCDVRIVWGGDATIEQLRRSPLRARATEVTFADRYSLAVINSDAYMSSEDKDRIASDFFNDTYLTDQNACTSPRVVAWTGSRRDEAKKIFWEKLHGLVLQKYAFQPIMAVDKLTQRCMAAMELEEISAAVKREEMSDAAEKSEKMNAAVGVTDNRLVVVPVRWLSPKLMDYRGNCGYFYEYDCDDVLGLRDFCDDTRCQTIGVLGDTAFLKPLIASGIKGVDRIVALGHTMDFDLNWDGYNLAERLTRTVVV